MAILVAAGPGIVGLGFGLVGLVALAVAVSLYVLAYIRRSGPLLRQREERFRDIAEMSDAWIWATDAENKLTFVSDRVETLTGWSKQDLLGTRSWDLSRASPGPWKEQQRAIQQRGRSVDYELETKTTDSTMKIIR